MANKRLGNHPSHNYQVVEKITEAKQLTWNDSGKMFFVEQGDGTYVVNLPKLSEEICGWQAIFFLSRIEDSVEINVYGSTAGGNSGATDEETMRFYESSHDTPSSNTTVDGMKFSSSAATIGTIISIHTDGTYWYSNGHGDVAGDIGNVGG